MKKLLLLIAFMGIASGIFAQVSKTVNVVIAGTLSTSLASNELATITNLTLTGTIDARDFKTMRDDMPLLAVLDLSGVKVVSYTGAEGTKSSWNPDKNYPNDAIPESAFIDSDLMKGSTSLISIVLPTSVTSIGGSAFWSCSSLKFVTIASSVTSIGSFAFVNCTSLTSITLPSSMTSIESGTFSECSNLKSINIPSSVTSIFDSAFQKCIGLTSVTIPSSVTSIGAMAFSGCSSLSSVTIPTSVTSIFDSAFEYCRGLTTFTIPSSVTSIESNVFSGCSSLSSVTIPTSVTSIGVEAFSYCYGLTTVTIPSSVTSIGHAAFYHCSGLTTVAIPTSVNSIEGYAFYYCSGLITVTIPSSVTSIGDYAFEGCSGSTSITTSNITPLNLSASSDVFNAVNKTTCTLYVPIGSKSAYQVADQWKDFTNIVEKDFTGIDPIISDQKMTIYPNPTTGKVKLVFDQIPQGGATLTVIDFTGKTILTQFIQNKEEGIDLGGNSPGVYLIRTNMKDFKVQKIILN